MKIWISYSLADKEFVSALKSQLQDVQLEVVDYDNAVKPGDNIEDAIYQSISAADTLLVVLSKESVNSYSLFTEIGMIISEIKNNRHKKFIPILLDIQIPIPLFIQSYKYLDLTNDKKQKEQITQLIEILKISNQRDILLEKEIDEYRNKNKQRQFSLIITLMGSMMSIFAIIMTFMYASNDFFSFNISKDTLMYVVSAAISVVIGVFLSIFFQMLKRK